MFIPLQSLASLIIFRKCFEGGHYFLKSKFSTLNQCVPQITKILTGKRTRDISTNLRIVSEKYKTFNILKYVVKLNQLKFCNEKITHLANRIRNNLGTSRRTHAQGDELTNKLSTSQTQEYDATFNSSYTETYCTNPPKSQFRIIINSR